jgi:hypothetical protein
MKQIHQTNHQPSHPMKSMKAMNDNSNLIDTLELLPYQADFAANNSRFKIGLWARQTGKDHTAAAPGVGRGIPFLALNRSNQHTLAIIY